MTVATDKKDTEILIPPTGMKKGKTRSFNGAINALRCLLM